MTDVSIDQFNQVINGYINHVYNICDYAPCSKVAVFRLDIITLNNSTKHK